MSFRSLLAVPLVCLCFACAHYPPKYDYQGRHTTIETDPPGARVYQIAPATGERIDLGVTPVRDQPVMVPVGANYHGDADKLPAIYSQLGMLRVRIEKPGYTTYEGNLTTGPTETIPHRVILTPEKP